jgi:hypothetical protein
MNEDQLKMKLYILQALDWIMFVSVMSFGVYAFFYAQNKFLMSLITILCLLLMDWVGKFMFDKTAVLRVELNIFRRRKGGYQM